MSSLALESGDGRGRPIKVSPEQVFEYLSDGDWHTVAEMAEAMDCGHATIRNRLRDLLDDGFMVLKGRAGARLVDGENMDQVTIEEIGAMLHWLFKSVSSMTHHAVPVKKMLPEIRKALPRTKSERQYLRSITVRITHLIDWDSIDDLSEV